MNHTASSNTRPTFAQLLATRDAKANARAIGALPAPTTGLPIHGPFLSQSASDAQHRRYFLRCWSRLIDAEPCPVDTGMIHGPAERDELPTRRSTPRWR